MSDLNDLLGLLYREGVGFSVCSVAGNQVVSWEVQRGRCHATFNREGTYRGVERDFDE